MTANPLLAGKIETLFVNPPPLPPGLFAGSGGKLGFEPFVADPPRLSHLISWSLLHAGGGFRPH